MDGPIDPNWLKDAKIVRIIRLDWILLNWLLVGSVVFTLTVYWLIRLFKVQMVGWLVLKKCEKKMM